jgi:hypothetical protein
MPIFVGETLTMSKSFIKYLNNTEEKHKVKERQTTAIQHTAQNTNAK